MTDPKHTPQALRDIIRYQVQSTTLEKKSDYISVEEPLQITLQHNGDTLTDISVTMRTPGNDKELAAGFLFSEGVIRTAQDINGFKLVDDDNANQQNHLIVELADHINVDTQRLQKNIFTHSACGVCGKTALQALELQHRPQLTPNQPCISSEKIRQLPEKLSAYQQQFAITGGVHSAALVDPKGNILEAWEDVGRHNAMDKLLGHLLIQNQLPQVNNFILLSGRLSFELVQKALMADISMLAAIGAPTSLALDLASRHGMTLIGFLKKSGFNIYSGEERIR